MSVPRNPNVKVSLKQVPGTQRYRVARLANTTELAIGQKLTKSEVDALIAKGWTVTTS
jgi:hypothetical protein